MAEASNTTVTLQVHRFTPRPKRAERARGGSPFAKKALRSAAARIGALSSARQAVGAGVHDSRAPFGYCVGLSADHQTHRRPDAGLPLFVRSWHVRFRRRGHQRHAHAAVHSHHPRLGQATRRHAEVDDEGFRHTGTEAEESDDSAENVANAAAAQNSAANGSLGVIELASLPGFPPQRDLIADIDPMLNQIRKLNPYLAGGRRARHHRRRQGGRVRIPAEPRTTRQIRAAEQLHRLRRVRRRLPGVRRRRRLHRPGRADLGLPFLVNDSRDTKAMERMDAIDTADGAAACQSVRACSRHCPRGIDVGEEMWQIVVKVRER